MNLQFRTTGSLIGRRVYSLCSECRMRKGGLGGFLCRSGYRRRKASGEESKDETKKRRSVILGIDRFRGVGHRKTNSSIENTRH